ncbi:hypothetical protein [Emticicia sp. 17c]|uniref:hypothetical protein n=1 Tax=Emticicia sp. 17c TaxID=3127704 RepID=UPI00301BB31A
MMLKQFYNQLKGKSFFKNLIELKRIFFSKKGEYSKHLNEEIYKDLAKYCAQSLKTDKDKIGNIYLLYTGFVTPEILQYFIKITNTDSYAIRIGQDIGVFEVKFNDSIYIFCKSVSYNYSQLKIGFFHKTTSLPPFTIYEVDYKKELGL